ncbi:MAG: hypothetical protein ACOX60_08735 [Massiliimalia sp.]|jgi:hypothetical protein
MKRNKSIGVRITQILAIIVLVLAVISSAFYFLADSSMSKAAENETVPEFAGKMYLPIETDNQKSIASKGDLIIAQKAEAADLEASQTVVYESPSLSTVNQVYGKYSMGVINSVNEEDGTTVLHVQTADGEIEAVSSTLVVGKATYSIAALGTLIMTAQSSMGIFWFVVLPLGLFIVLQLISIICRVIAGSQYEEDEDDDDEYDDEYDEYEEEYEEESDDEYASYNSYDSEDDSSEYDEEDSEPEQPPVKRVQRFLDTPPKITQIRSETVSSMDNEFSGFGNSELLRPFRSSGSDEATNGPIDPASAAAEDDQPKAPLVPGSFGSPADEVKTDEEYHGIVPFLSENETVSHTPSKAVRLEEEDDEEFRREMMRQTMEFDMKAIRERMKKNQAANNHTVKKPAGKVTGTEKKTDPQQLLDKILIEVKDHAVDFNFEDLKDEQVKVERRKSGDGFVIKTPQYRANIKVEIDDSEEK